jgi:hypothetical protein
MSRSQLARALLVASALVGCSSSESEDCTSDVAPSVLISVVDANGVSVPDAKVTYSVDGGPVAAAGCYARVNPGCGRWQAGSEEKGAFSLVATSADGAKTAKAEVLVTGGGCGSHVKTAETTLTLR